MKDTTPPLNPIFLAEIDSHLIERLKNKVEPSANAVTKSMIEAVVNPGSLIRITCSSVDELSRVCFMLSHAAVDRNLHREKETVSNSKDGWPVIELRNGSGIEVAIDRTVSGDHEKRV